MGNLSNIDISHCIRVALICTILAKKDGINDINMVQISALCHDVGKITLPSVLLNKKGTLSKEEYEIITNHALQGSQLLSAAAIIAKDHHEKMDGSGYLGLSEDQIHPIAKMVAVADTFDALISKRNYKPPWSMEDVKKYMFHEVSEEHYDPHWVEMLFSSIPEIVNIYSNIK